MTISDINTIGKQLMSICRSNQDKCKKGEKGYSLEWLKWNALIDVLELSTDLSDARLILVLKEYVEKSSVMDSSQV